MYYNTTHSTGPDLTEYRAKARKQEDVVFAHFAIKNKPMSASMVHSNLVSFGVIGSQVPLTSIRRAITNLTTSNLLRKTDKQRTGPFGKPEYLYSLAAGQQELFE